MDYLEENEMQALLDSVDLNLRTGVRDKALLLLLYNTGARVSEIVGLKVADLRLYGSTQVKLLGKGNKYRSCPLWSETVEALETYLKQHTAKDPADHQLFLNANGVHPSHDSVFGTSWLNTPPQLKANAHPLRPKLSPHTPSATQQPCICCVQETMLIWSAAG